MNTQGLAVFLAAIGVPQSIKRCSTRQMLAI
jgi:hypothetical protein